MGREGKRMASKLFLYVVNMDKSKPISNIAIAMQKADSCFAPSIQRKEAKVTVKNTFSISSHQKNSAHEISPTEKRNQ